MYIAGDMDEKALIVKHLQKNLEAILTRLYNLLEERTQCLKYLAVTDSDIGRTSLYELLVRKINDLNTNVETTVKVSKEEIGKLVTEATRHERKAEEAMVKCTETAQRLEREIARLNILLAQAKEGHVEEVLSSKTSSGTQVEQVWFSRDCCIQVELSGEKRPPVLCMEPILTVDVCHDVANVIPGRQSVLSSVHDDNQEKGNSKLESPNSKMNGNLTPSNLNGQFTPIEPLVLNHINGDAGSTTSFDTDTTESEFSIRKGLTGMPLALQHREYTHLTFQERDKFTVNTLKNQVNDLAVKLRKAKGDLDFYEKQIISDNAHSYDDPFLHSTGMHNGGNKNNKARASLWKDTRNKNKVAVSDDKMSMLETKSNGEVTARSGYTHRSSDSVKTTSKSDGYLSGIKQDILPNQKANYKPPDSLYMKSHFRKVHAGATERGQGLTNGTTRCLRCHKIYTARENHKMSCRYHPKSKKKIEKYDHRGKLLMVTYIFECCMQRTDAAGCCIGEHV